MDEALTPVAEGAHEVQLDVLLIVGAGVRN
jgi:hypothetical protein